MIKKEYCCISPVCNLDLSTSGAIPIPQLNIPATPKDENIMATFNSFNDLFSENSTSKILYICML